jgi:hypothetical protein
MAQMESSNAIDVDNTLPLEEIENLTGSPLPPPKLGALELISKADIEKIMSEKKVTNYLEL